MLPSIFRIVESYIQWFLCPPFCVYCKKLLHAPLIFCTRCFDRIKPIVSTQLTITAQKSLTVYAISGYYDPVKSLILAKIQSQRLASKQLGELIWFLTPLSNREFDYIVPIPLHWTRYAYRGYNQAEEIAKIIAKKSGKPVISLLKRDRRTIFQSSLPIEQRADNVASVFSLHMSGNAKEFAGKRFLLVDDLMTTGSTLKSAARIIMHLKPASIDAVVASRTFT